jgi:hypothetical protein
LVEKFETGVGCEAPKKSPDKPGFLVQRLATRNEIMPVKNQREPNHPRVRRHRRRIRRRCRRLGFAFAAAASVSPTCCARSRATLFCQMLAA